MDLKSTVRYIVYLAAHYTRNGGFINVTSYANRYDEFTPSQVKLFWIAHDEIKQGIGQKKLVCKLVREIRRYS